MAIKESNKFTRFN